MKKTIALLLALCMLLPLAACGEKPAEPAPQPTVTEPEPASAAEPEPEPAPAPQPEPEPVKIEYTREQLQDIVLETAFAYYNQNPYIQYDSTYITVENIKRLTSGDAPEDASFDNMVYSVCSDFIYDVYYNAFGYKLMGKPKNVLTAKMVARPVTDPIIVYKYGGSDGEQDLDKAMKEARAILQPGDMIVGYGDTGHAMMYVGDIYGDGHEYLIHCWGGKVDMETGTEKTEKDGAIFIQDVDVSVFQPGGTRGWYLANPKCGTTFVIMRPLDAADMVAEPTPSALARVKYRGITVHRDLDRWLYDSITSGEEIPVTVTVENRGKEAYKDVCVTEHLPEGQTLVSGSASTGAAIDGDTVKWTLDIPAGGKAELTYRVKVTGKLGDSVVFPAGDVAGIPTREIPMVVGGKPLSEQAQIKLMMTTAETLSPELAKPAAFPDLDFANRVYKEVLGVDPGIPATASDLVENLAQRKKALGQEFTILHKRDTPVAGYEKAAQMIIPKHITGFYVSCDTVVHSRVTEYKEEYYKPGDVFVGIGGDNTNRVMTEKGIEIFVYLGANRVLSCSAANGVELKTFANTIGLAMKYNIFFGLRPTLTVENLG